MWQFMKNRGATDRMIHTIDLNGEWDFFYSPQGFVPGETPLPNPGDFTGRMVTPGYWDDHWELFSEEDFFGLTARFNPDYRPVVFPMARSLTPHAASSFLIGTGFYRRSVAFEAAVELAVLQVGPAMWGCSVFCNGELCGVQTGYSTATDFDLTPHLRRDSANEIVIAVCNRRDDGGAYCRLDGRSDTLSAQGARVLAVGQFVGGVPESPV